MALTQDKDNTVIIRFGGGLNSQGIPADIDPRECSAGQNFELSDSQAYFRPRRAFVQAALAPNGQGIRGGAQLIKADGTRSVLIQAGGVIYTWNGALGVAGLSPVATCSPGAALRGTLAANSVKDSKVYIADLNQQEVVKTWDGTTFTDLVHNLSSPFYARYIAVHNERAFYGNIKASTSLPHVIAASQRDALGTLTTANRPSSSLAAADPFFLPTPNLAPITGIIPAFQKLAIATRSSKWWRLNGDDATDHSLAELSAALGGEGQEEIVYTGNDVVFGKVGGIDSLSATERFGDTKSDDLSRWIHDEVKTVRGWTLAYNERLERLYCLPQNGGKLYVLYRALLDARNRAALFGAQYNEISPWSKWVTAQSMNFDPLCVLRLLHPRDGLEHVFLGGRDGYLYQLESDNAFDPQSVGGSTSNTITFSRTSKTIRLPGPPSQMYNITGWVKARKMFASALTLTVLWGGTKVRDETASSITLTAATNAPVWSGPTYWGGSGYWGLSFNGRIHRKDWNAPGASDDLQIKVDGTMSTTSGEAWIEEVGIQIKPERA